VKTLRKGDRGPDVVELQSHLDLVVDGIFGPDTESAVKEFQRESDLDDDGIVGPLTWSALLADDPAQAPVPVPGSTVEFENWDGPATRQPRNSQETYDLLGNPGTVEADPVWEKQNIVWCHANGSRAVLPGVPEKYWVGVHKVVEPYLREALLRCQQSSSYKIDRLGCYVFRHIRHDPERPLSVHSWGAAVDINSQDNAARSFDRGTAPQAWSPEWNKIWPKGMPPEFIAAFRSCGFAWGSDWDEDGSTEDEAYLDTMHFEWIARDGEGHLV
jgi:hypothetical protein